MRQFSLNNFEKFYKDERVPIIIGGFIIFLILLGLYQVGVSINEAFQKMAKQPDYRVRIQKVSDISKFHLFGVFEDSLRDLPETRLQLILEGTVVNTDNSQLSYAIISSPNEPTKIYKIGQTLPGGAILRRILKDQVIIDDDGSLESLRLPLPPLITPTEQNN